MNNHFTSTPDAAFVTVPFAVTGMCLGMGMMAAMPCWAPIYAEAYRRAQRSVQARQQQHRLVLALRVGKESNGIFAQVRNSNQ